MYSSKKKIVTSVIFVAIIFESIVGICSDTALRYLVGIPQNVTYREGDAYIKLQWSLLPVGATTFNLKCHQSSSFTSQRKTIISSNVSSAKVANSGLGRLDGRVSLHVSMGILQVTISSPRLEDEGWYFCEMNTVHGTDVGGAVQLSRKIVTSLPYLVGMHQQYRDGDGTVTLQWLFSPPGATKPWVRCFYSPSLTDPKKEVLSKTILSEEAFTLTGQMKGRARVKLATDFLHVTLDHPKPQDEGWYFCEIKSMQNVPVYGALKLSRRIDNLESVLPKESTFSRSNNNANLTWRYFPSTANILKITCLYKSLSESTWVKVAKYMTKDDKLNGEGRFLNRIHQYYNKKSGIFNLLLRELSRDDQGLFDCEFTAEHSSLKESKISAKLRLKYTDKLELQMSTTVSQQPVPNDTHTAGSTKNPGSTCIRWQVFFGVAVVCFTVCLPWVLRDIYKRYSLHNKKKFDESGRSNQSLETGEFTPLKKNINTENENNEQVEQERRNNEAKQEEDPAKENLEQLKSDLENAKLEKHELLGHSKALEDELQEKKLEIGQLTGELNTTKKRLTELRIELTKANDQKNELEEQLKEKDENIGKLAKAIEQSTEFQRQRLLDQRTTEQGIPATSDGIDSATACQKKYENSARESDLQRRTNSDGFHLKGGKVFADAECPSSNENQPSFDAGATSLGEVDLKRQRNPKDQAVEEKGKELCDILNSLNLLELYPTFFSNNIDPSMLHRIKDVFFEEMGVETIGDIIHLRHFQRLKYVNKENAPDVHSLLVEIDCKEYEDALISQKVAPDDFQYLSGEHFDRLGVDDVRKRTKIRTTTRESPDWTKCCERRRESQTVGFGEQEQLQEIEATPPCQSQGETERKGVILPCQSQDDTERICTAVDAMHRKIFCLPKCTMGDSGEVGSVVLLNEDMTDVACLVSGMDNNGDSSKSTLSLLQSCFSRFLIEDISSNTKEYTMNVPAGGYQLKQGVQIHVYLSAPSCIPLCTATPGCEGQEQKQNSNGFPQILKWQLLGFQGPLLSHLMDPVYISLMVINGACHDKCLQSSIEINNFDDICKKMPQPYQSPFPLRIERRKSEATVSEPLDKGLYKYWYKGKDNVIVIKTETELSPGTSEGSEIVQSSLLTDFKKIPCVPHEMHGKEDKELHYGSISYQQATKVLQELETDQIHD